MQRSLDQMNGGGEIPPPPGPVSVKLTKDTRVVIEYKQGISRIEGWFGAGSIVPTEFQLEDGPPCTLKQIKDRYILYKEQ